MSMASRSAFTSPRQAFDCGIAMVFQEQSILPTLTVAENIFLGREEEFLRFGLISKSRMNAAAAAELKKVHLDVHPGHALRRTLLRRPADGGDRQGAVARQPHQGRRHHPARRADLGSRAEGSRPAFRIVDDLKSRASFVFISHRLEEVLEISDRVYVMRDGKVVKEMPRSDATVKELHQHMVGRQLQHEYYREARQATPGDEVVLDCRQPAQRRRLSRISASTCIEGEVMGIAGVIGSGREELARCLAGHARTR